MSVLVCATQSDGTNLLTGIVRLSPFFLIHALHFTSRLVYIHIQSLIARIISTGKRTGRIPILQILMDRLDSSDRSGNHDKGSDDEKRNVHRHDEVPPCRPLGRTEVVPHPHVGFHLDTDDSGEEGPDEGSEC